MTGEPGLADHTVVDTAHRRKLRSEVSYGRRVGSVSNTTEPARPTCQYWRLWDNSADSQVESR